MPVVAPLALPRVQLFDASGHPLAGCLLDTYIAGTSTPLATYSDALGTTPNTNPVVADPGGYMDVYLITNTAYKLRVSTSPTPGPSVVLATIDNLVLRPRDALASIDDFSATVTQRNLTLDPGEPGAEVLATNGAEEIQQLRFRIGEMTGVNWAQTTTLRKALGTLVFTRSGLIKTTGSLQAISSDGTWQDATTTNFFYRLPIPDGWVVNSDILLKILRHSTSASGTSRMTANIFRYRDGAGAFTVASQDIDFIPGDTNSHLLTLLVNGGSYAIGDIISVQVARLGGDVSDTNNGGAVASDGFWFEFQGVPTNDGTWQSTGLTTATYAFQVPDGYLANSDIFLSIFRRATSSSGTSRMTAIIQRIRDGVNATVVATTDYNFIPGDTNSHKTDLLANGAFFQTGDILLIQVNRLGDDGADTHTGQVLPDGHWFTYQGVASR